MQHKSSSLHLYKYLYFVLSLFIILSGEEAAAQTISVLGPTCALKNSTCHYSLSCSDCSYGQTTITWSVSGGTIVSGGNGSPYVDVTWTSQSGGTVAVSTSNPTHNNISLNVTLYAALQAGTITSSNQHIAFNTIPATINCTAASGGYCSPTYSYQWQYSLNNISWSNLAGAKSQNLSFSQALTQTTYYRRKDSVNATVAYTSSSTVVVDPPPIIVGATTPTYQLVNAATAEQPADMVAQPASGGNCSGECPFIYQWQQLSGTSWVNISNAKSLSYNPGTGLTTGLHYYRLRVYDGTQYAYSKVDTIQIQSSIIGGPTNCWTGQTVTYYYHNSNASNFVWNPPNGCTVISGINSADFVIKWTSAPASGTVPVNLSYKIGSTTYNAVLSVSVRTISLDPGTIGIPVVYIEQNATLTLNPSPPKGGSCTGSFAYQWQKTTNIQNTSFTAVSGQTSGNLSMVVTQNAYYRRSVVCSTTAYTDTTQLIVFPYFSPGTITLGANDSIAWNTAPSIVSGSMPTGGINSNYLYQWEYSLNGSDFYPVSNNGNGVNYQPEILTTSTFYRRQVTCGITSRYTNTVKVLVKQNKFNPGVISPYTLVISAGTGSSLTGTTATGGTSATYSYQWQQSDDELSWKNCTNGTSQNYNTGTLSKTTYYRRLVTNGAQSGFSLTNGTFYEIKIKVVQGLTGPRIPTAALQSTPDAGITEVPVNGYEMPSINTAKVNYVRSWDIEKPGQTTIAEVKALTDVNDFNQVTTYFDDLGRQIQTVAKGATPTQKDLITISNYDILGREVQQFLPYTDNVSSGLLRTNAATQQPAFYNNLFSDQEGYYYSNTVYEKSPLNRVLKKTSPGNAWTGNNVGTRYDYNFNTVYDSVVIWTIGNSLSSSPSYVGMYAPGALSLIVTTDENENKVIEYKNKDGKVILKKVQLSDTLDNGYKGWLSTYYVYDDFNRLRYVLPPKAVDYAVANNWTVPLGIRNNLCFKYYYDEKSRVAVKKVPGSGEVWTVYDARDRLVMTQDSMQRAAGQWIATDYDSLNRVVRTVLWNDINDRDYHQSLADASVTYPNPVSGTFALLSKTYYDDYSWVSGTNLSGSFISTYSNNPDYFYSPSNTTSPYPQAIAGTNMTIGMTTGSMATVLNSTKQLSAVNFYDDHGRLVQTQSNNNKNGIDTLTNQYAFDGKLLRTLLCHGKPGTNPQAHKVITKTLYDPAGRVTQVSKIIDSGPEVIMAANQYNALGQLIKKKLGQARNPDSTYSTNPVDSLRYAYNVRGWLKGINSDYSRKQHSAVNWFGEDLSYDYGFSSSELNGNIAGIQWRSRGDGEQRAYGFSYDNANKLLNADYNQLVETSWDKTKTDFTASNITYDNNGNILTMDQKGMQANVITALDQLQYAYLSNSNQLSYVRDNSPGWNSTLGDFKEINNNNTRDYYYDGNGNLIQDNNKAITSITYNYLNLPESIAIKNKGTVGYTYDAAGNKLQKVTVDSTVTPVKTTTTDYIGSFVYENNNLQYVSTEEGRARPVIDNNADNFYYDYFEKDHLGNVRVVLTDQIHKDYYPAATLEGNINGGNNKPNAIRIEKDYYTINIGNVVSNPSGIPDYPNNNGIYNNNPYSYVDSSSKKVYKLTGTSSAAATGLNITLKVMSGDKIDILGKSYWTQHNTAGDNTNLLLADIVSALLATPDGLAASKGATATGLTTGSNALSLPSTFLTRDPGSGDTKPMAYINYILLDDQFQWVKSGVSRVGSAGSVKDHFSDLQDISVTKNGYLYVYCSNQSPVDVFFDNLQIVQTRSPLIEETHYYPFGLTMAGISSKALAFGEPENKCLFNKGSELQNKEFSDGSGLELYATNFRSLDPQLGRWWQIDPKPDYAQSLYSAMNNNPISFNDPLGDTGRLPEFNKAAAYKAYVEHIRSVNNKYKKNAPPLFSFTATTSVGLVGVHTKILGVGVGYSTSNNQKDIAGIRDNKRVKKADQQEYVNGMDASIGVVKGSVKVESEKPMSQNGNLPADYTTEQQMGVVATTDVKKDRNGQTLYEGAQFEIFSIKGGWVIGGEVSLNLNVTTGPSVATPPPDFNLTQKDNTNVVKNIPNVQF